MTPPAKRSPAAKQRAAADSTAVTESTRPKGRVGLPPEGTRKISLNLRSQLLDDLTAYSTRTGNSATMIVEALLERLMEDERLSRWVNDRAPRIATERRAMAAELRAGKRTDE